MATENVTQQEVDRLLKLDVDRQYMVLAARLQQLQGIVGTEDIALAGPPDVLIKFGKSWLASFVNQVYERICDEKGDWHDGVVNAVNGGVTSLAVSLASLAISGLGVAPAIAAAVGAIIASQYFKGVLEMGGQATVKALCKTLQEHLPTE